MLDPALGSPEASYLYDVKGARAYHEGRLADVEQLGVQALSIANQSPQTLLSLFR